MGVILIPPKESESNGQNMLDKKIKQNQTPREHFIEKEFEIRIGKFYNPNEGIAGTPPKMEIRILHPINNNIWQFENLAKLIKEWVTK